MKVLLDEQLSPLIAGVLRDRGLDVEAVSERADLLEAADHEVLDTATREQRAVVTNDVKDFRPLTAERLTDGRGHAGVILVAARYRRRRADSGSLADAIEAVMRAHPAGIANSECWLAPGP